MTPHTLTPQSMDQRVLQAIRQQKLAMRSKWRVILPHVLIVGGAVLLALAFILHTSSLLYGFHLNGSWNLLQADLRNIQYVLRSFPWLLVGIPLLLAIAFAVVLSRTTRVFRLPLIYTVIAIPLVIVGLSALIETIPGHEQLQEFTTSSVPVVGTLYKNVAEQEPPQTYLGEVRDATVQGFTLINRKGEEIPVEVTATTKHAAPAPVANDQVVQVIGKEHKGKVSADAIQKVPVKFQDEVRKSVEKAEEKKNEEREEKSEILKTEQPDVRGSED